MLDDTLSLDLLPPDCAAVVAGYDEDFPAARRQRFEDLGLLPETPLTRVHTAPLGDPIAFDVRGSILCLRVSDARRIRVRRAS